MLLNLHVKNFALIEEADIDFGDGLNILTGETGAGKSLLIDAVNAALGGRLRGDMIRSGSDFAYTELVFSVPEAEKREQLAALDVSTEYECIVISRKMLPGRSVHKINDETVTSAKVRQVTALLLDIHGQHEHQSLMRREKHLEVLDAFGGTAVQTQREQVAAAYQKWQEARRERAAFQVDPEERRRQMDFLRFEIQEIEEAAVRPGETEELTRAFRKMNNSQKICGSLRDVADWMDGSTAAAEQISRAARELAGLVRLDEDLADLSQELAEIEDLVSSFNRELSDYLEGLTFDPEEFRETEDRLDLLQRLESKYGDSYEKMQKTLTEKQQSLADLEEWEVRKRDAEQKEAACRQELQETADRLTALRRQILPRLQEELQAGICELNFSHVEFCISLETLEEPGKNGQDQVEFLISLNEGEEPRPLGRVASGGELSRIMLAIKAVLADKDEIPTLIFDEIDTGISGRTAQKVSEKLSLIGRHRQVICITHLPQIASMADHHFCIRKTTRGSHTLTSVIPLDENASIDELARLLGGAEMTEAVYQNACDMKALATKVKKNLPAL
ncbi:MAG: DNA repair protein RecN [Lachnospiraceae bacterium]|nr:DNA repair protein RecN [Lachnospiraceae bacterium]